MLIRVVMLLAMWIAVIAATPLDGQELTHWVDPSPHEASLIRVEDDIEVEVLDWGGAGGPLVLLAGLGNTAHVFDDFAPDLTALGRVIGITRRGFGASTLSASDYSLGRLGEDILRVLDALSIGDDVVLLGHSIAGQELSYLATRHSSRLAGVVYLDAAYAYAFNPPGLDDAIRTAVVEAGVEFAAPPRAPAATEADLASFPALANRFERVQGFALPEAEFRQTRSLTDTGGVGPRTDDPGVRAAILEGEETFTDIPIPALAIFSIRHTLGPWTNDDPADSTTADTFLRFEKVNNETIAAAFRNRVQGSRVTLLPGASHFIFITHKGEVVGEIADFLETLPK